VAEEAVTGRAQLTALAQLEGMTITRLARVLRHHDADEAFHRVVSGRVGAEVADERIRRAWAMEAGSVALVSLDEKLAEFGVEATSWHDPDHPVALTADIDPAPVLFRIGRLPPVDSPRVAIVGTRRCSGAGLETAYELGSGLAAAGVVVVSGLAIGVDGAAHEGALAARGAPPLAVVGSGPDIVYPRRHRILWQRVAERGCLCTEAPLGAEPAAWRFPARNRLIAAFADLVVVVESRLAGGSLLTVEQAIRRGVDVMAVPGSVRNPAAEGANQLLVDGCAPVRSTSDVLLALGLSVVERSVRRAGDTPLPKGRAATVLAAVDDGPTTIDEIVGRCGLEVRAVLAQVEILLGLGHLVADGARVRRA